MELDDKVVLINNHVWMLMEMYNTIKRLEAESVWGIKLKLKEIKMIVNNDLKDYKENQVNLFIGLSYKEMLIIVTVDKDNVNYLIQMLQDLKLSLVYGSKEK